jgi:hypothetical protein
MSDIARYLEWATTPLIKAWGKPGPRYWTEAIGWASLVETMKSGGEKGLTKEFISWRKQHE